jgi:hypothetical protein
MAVSTSHVTQALSRAKTPPFVILDVVCNLRLLLRQTPPLLDLHFLPITLLTLKLSQQVTLYWDSHSKTLQLRPSLQPLPRELDMEPNLPVHEDSAKNAAEVSSLPTTQELVSEEQNAGEVITSYLLAEVEEYRELSRLRQEVNPFDQATKDIL